MIALDYINSGVHSQILNEKGLVFLSGRLISHMPCIDDSKYAFVCLIAEITRVNHPKKSNLRPGAGGLVGNVRDWMPVTVLYVRATCYVFVSCHGRFVSRVSYGCIKT